MVLTLETDNKYGHRCSQHFILCVYNKKSIESSTLGFLACGEYRAYQVKFYRNIYCLMREFHIKFHKEKEYTCGTNHKVMGAILIFE